MRAIWWQPQQTDAGAVTREKLPLPERFHSAHVQSLWCESAPRTFRITAIRLIVPDVTPSLTMIVHPAPSPPVYLR